MAEEANPAPARWQESTVASSESHAGAAQAQVEPGELLAQRFRVVRTLARGGMGLVLEAEAEDEELGASVALKLVLPELADSPAAVDRLRRDVALARSPARASGNERRLVADARRRLARHRLTQADAALHHRLE